tara:strand:- start:69 stop:626 length:558 start_codon:yes stop_codon:yes gene_type:complete
MNNKRAMQLSINFLVVIILGIAMLVMGVVFVRKMFTGASDIKANLDKQTEEELENLMTSGERVAIPYTKKEVRAGKTVIFGLGILNVLGEDSNFVIDIECGGTVPDTLSCMPVNDIVHPFMINDLSVENNDQHKMPIAIKAPSDKGTYIIDIRICNYIAGDPVPTCTTSVEYYDGSLHKIYVKVS